jgi:hypothetical protein
MINPWKNATTMIMGSRCLKEFFRSPPNIFKLSFIERIIAKTSSSHRLVWT